MDQDDGPPSARGPGRGRGSIRARGTRIGMGRMPMSRQGGRAAATPHMHGDPHLHDLDDRSEHAAVGVDDDKKSDDEQGVAKKAADKAKQD